MEELIREQLVQKELLEIFMTNYNKDGKERRTYSYYQKRLKEFDSLWNQAKEFHRKILIQKMAKPKETESKKFPYFEKDIFSEMESDFINNYSKIEERFQKEFPSVETAPQTENREIKILQTKGESSIKLPKITLEKFSGDYLKWPTFFDLFRTLVHENQSLSGVQKLQYLKLHVTGEAEHLLRHFQVTEENYESAWNLLRDRFDNKRILVNTQLRTLLSQNIITHESARGIKTLLDTTTECLQALENLGVATKEWGVIIVYLTVQKLPSETHALWEQTLSNKKDLPTWEQLKEFLEARFRTLEAVVLKGNFLNNKNSRNSFIKSNKGPQTFHSSSKPSCPVCNGPHFLRQCHKFSLMEFSKRLELVKSKGLCINCLGFGHLLAKCPSLQHCVHCGQRHHTLMHRNSNESMRAANQVTCEQPESGFVASAAPSQSDSSRLNIQPSMSASAPSFVSQKNSSNPTNLSSFFVNKLPDKTEVLLATALVRVVAPSGSDRVLRALIDPGSQASFVTESASQSLNLPREQILSNVCGVGQTNVGQATARVHLVLKALTNEKIALKVSGLVLKKLTHLLPLTKLSVQNWKHIQGLELADPLYHKPGKIDLLLGADVYSDIIQSGLIKGEVGSPIAQKTVFGWILSGNVNSNQNETITIQNFHVLSDLDRQLKQFWELEEVSQDRVLSNEERQCEENFEANCKRLKDGRYEVALPFREIGGENYIGESRSKAVSRLLQMERRFKRNATLQKEYTQCLREYIQLEHMEVIPPKEGLTEIDDKEQGFNYCYLPHHAVTKEDSTTTKLRVVFDASQETKTGISLNDVLLKGPTIQDEVACLLLRWRKYQFAFTSDIEKMYRQVRIKPEHADFQRIVWRESTDEMIQDYRLLTVTFGTKSAPYLATRVLKQLSIDGRHQYPIGAEVVQSEFYVDDLLSGGDSLEQALQKQTQVIELLRSGGFNLRKWASNHLSLLTNIPEQHRETKVNLIESGAEQVKALGLYWDPVKDELCYSLKFQELEAERSKRTILSQIARLFDPLGWAAPTLVIAKIFMQKLWLEKLDWDDALPDRLLKEWLEFRKGMMELGLIRLPRWTKISGSGDVEIHGFCDSSMLAYAAVVYVCVIDSNGRREVNLLAAKTKVAPIKTVSLPRLELCAAVLLAKLLRYVIRALRLNNIPSYAWTDSEIVLAWLKGHPAKWKTFIANRTSLIHELVAETTWRHVPSRENPADIATRGMLPAELQSYTLWWHGPTWLIEPKMHWPRQKSIPETNVEIRKTHVNTMQISCPVEKLEQRYSSLTRLLRITAYLFRFKSRQRGYVKANELKVSLFIWIRKTQSEHFSGEINRLRRNKPIDKNSRILKLTPFLDSDGLLRVGGRLRHTNLSFDEKHPIILPDKAHLTNLIIDNTHKYTLHGGPQLMMRVLAKRYWLLNARNTIRYHIHKCIPCFRQRAEVQTQLMGDLPRPRVTMSRPFSHVGVDYCGPFELKRYRGRGSRNYKGYLSIFICMAVKAIHIEIVSDLSSQGFLAAFRRFASRRGLPSDVYCDCGSNFVGANKILTRQLKQMVDGLDVDIAKLFENEGVNFHFIPPASPHFGGLWESGVRSTKHHLKRILGNTTLTYEELSTVITQIEACLNSRPLCPASRNPEDATSLTPAHFLIGDVLVTPAEPSVLGENIHRLDRWQYMQNLYQHFWKRWKAEYLCLLQQRPKWMQKEPNIKNDDLVIIKEENLPPSRWLLGRIINTHPGSDELVRVVTIKTKDSVLKRPIAKICRLPLETYDDKNY